jgi:hypothetical protein
MYPVVAWIAHRAPRGGEHAPITNHRSLSVHYLDVLSLDALANWEMAVLASIRGAGGTAAERDAQITRSGLYAEYPAIFGAYVELVRLAADEAVALEALKRVVFLAWWAFSVPSIDSGIAELPESSVREVMQLLESAISGGRTDDELQAMLAWYHSRFGYVFEHFGPVRELETFVAETPEDEARARVLAGPFAGRGQLGVYWSAR